MSKFLSTSVRPVFITGGLHAIALTAGFTALYVALHITPVAPLVTQSTLNNSAKLSKSVTDSMDFGSTASHR